MNKMMLWKVGGLACLFLIWLTLLAGMTTHRPFEEAYANVGQDQCSDPIENCKPPVRFVGDKDGCACFACEHGKRTQRLVCTRDESNKKILFQKVRDSGGP
ncbi:MAG: hypothetical protein WAU45_20245 [Blastocatellia bacterium]